MRNGGGLITSQRAEIFPAFCLFFQSAIFGRHYAAKTVAAGRPDGVRRIPDKVAQFPTNACEDLADVGFDPRARVTLKPTKLRQNDLRQSVN